MQKYRFCKFSLCDVQGLYYEKQSLNIPPKELGVLNLLVSNAGGLVTKEDIIREVWKCAEVADESITRCVYILRKILSDRDNGRYIETVYGKGYRFIQPVQKEVVKEECRNNFISELIALFPFRMTNPSVSLFIFDYIIGLGDMFAEHGIEFMPAAMTVDVRDFGDSFISLREAGAGYFLTGRELSTANQKVVKLELIRSSTLLVVDRFSIMLDDDITLNLMNFNSSIALMLKRLRQSENERMAKAVLTVSNKNYDIAQNYNSYSIFYFEGNRNLGQLLKNIKEYDADTLCNLAGCYLALAMLGIMDHLQAEDIIKVITDRVMFLDPGNALAVSMRALMNSSMTDEGESEFHLAMILSPLSGEVYYYYSCYLVRKKKIDKAKKIISMSISLKPNFFAAKLLFLVIKAICGDVLGAIQYARSLLGNDKSCDIIINALLSVLLVRADRHDEAIETLKLIKNYRERCAFVSCVYNFVIENGRANMPKKLGVNSLTNITQPVMPKNSVYWLPFFDETS